MNLIPLLKRFIQTCALSLMITGVTAAPQLDKQNLPQVSSSEILINNVLIFDGKNEHLTRGNVLIAGNKIKKISTAPLQVTSSTKTLDGGGRVLMPGMIDTHVHITMAAIKFSTLLNSDGEYIGIIAANEALRTLMRGFTTIRDMAGKSFGLKEAIDEGQTIGPRIYPSGAALSQTGGHMDLNSRLDKPRRWGGGANPSEKIGAGIIADGILDVLTAAREQLRLGASQIKVMGSGGIATKYDPIDVVEYSEDEIRAAVTMATNWGTYVAVHVYNPEGIRKALNAGAKSIEHGNLIDDQAMKLLAEKKLFFPRKLLSGLMYLLVLEKPV